MRSNSQAAVVNPEEEKKKLDKKLQTANILIVISIVLLVFGCAFIILWQNLLQLGIGITLVIVPGCGVINQLLIRRKTQKAMERMNQPPNLT